MVTRYDLHQVHLCGEQPRGEMRPTEGGEWVLFDDVSRAIHDDGIRVDEAGRVLEQSRKAHDLLRCPLCGGNPRLVKKEGFGRAGGKYSHGYVVCNRCGITTPTKTPWEKARDLWNLRYSSPVTATPIFPPLTDFREFILDWLPPDASGDDFKARLICKLDQLNTTERR